MQIIVPDVAPQPLKLVVSLRPCLHGGGGPRSSGVGFFCFVSARAWKQKKPTPLNRGPPLHVNRPVERFEWRNTQIYKRQNVE